MIYKIIVALATFSGLVLCSVSCGPSMPPEPPPVVKKSTIKLSNSIQVQVEEESSQGWDDSVYEYRFVHRGKPIASSWEWNGSMNIQTGNTGNTVYFFQRKLICIYANSRWATWSMGEKSFTAWWNNFEKAYGSSWASTPDTMSNFGIEAFRANGKNWTIKLHTGTTKSYKTDWSKGLIPKYIHVQSNDFGKNWSVRETINLKRSKIKQ